MKNYLKQLTQPISNEVEVTKLLVQLLNIKISNVTLRSTIEEHPNYPSLLSINDALNSYRIETLAIKSSKEKLAEYPFPFIAHIKGTKLTRNYFTVVKEIKSQLITYYDPERHQWKESAKEDFIQRWSGVALLVENKEATGEEDYAKKLRQEARGQVKRYLAYLFLPILAFVTTIFSFDTHGMQVIFPFIFSLLSSSGVIISGFLLWYDLDQNNPFLQKICTHKRRINCDAILHSKKSKIAGISWSSIGLSFFLGNLLSLVLIGLVDLQAHFLLFWTTVLALPFVIFSIYYQWQIMKQWCIFCLLIQALLISQFVLSFLDKWYLTSLVTSTLLQTLIIFIFSFLSPFLVIQLILPTLRNAKEGDENKRTLRRLKHDPVIFNALLDTQKTLPEDTLPIGLMLGNPQAKYKIVKVCNPYCTPCAQSHPTIEGLLHNNQDVQVQIIFTETGNKSSPVKHFMALADRKNEAVLKQALHDWYCTPEKNYEKFAAKYEMNGELQMQTNKIEKMQQWCEKKEILFTPTFFINGRQLPEIYSADDLKYLLFSLRTE